MPGVRQLRARAPAELGARRRALPRARAGGRASDECVAPHERLESVLAETQRLFDESVAARMISDVPLGVFLSGGVDSTLVAIAAAKASSERLQTFTVGYDVGAVSETAQARAHGRLSAQRAPRGDAHRARMSPSARPRCWPSIDQPLADRGAAAAERAVGVRATTRDGRARRRGRRRAVRRLPALPLAGAFTARARSALRVRPPRDRSERCCAAAPSASGAASALRGA